MQFQRGWLGFSGYAGPVGSAGCSLEGFAFSSRFRDGGGSSSSDDHNEVPCPNYMSLKEETIAGAESLEVGHMGDEEAEAEKTQANIHMPHAAE